MPRTSRVAALALGVSCIGLFGCSRTIAATYPGGAVVQYPWQACGTDCAKAFAEIEATHDATGKDCDELVATADSPGSDDRVAAAALYDSAIVMVLRNKPADAADRFARAQARSPDADVDRIARLSQESAQRYPVLTPQPASPSTAPASTSTSPMPPATVPTPTTAPPVGAPASAPSSPVPAALPTTPSG